MAASGRSVVRIGPHCGRSPCEVSKETCQARPGRTLMTFRESQIFLRRVRGQSSSSWWHERPASPLEHLEIGDAAQSAIVVSSLKGWPVADDAQSDFSGKEVARWTRVLTTLSL